MQKKGQYRVATCCAISGHTPLFGPTMPLLCVLELHEHIYIRGPYGGAHKAIELFSQIIYQHILELEGALGVSINSGEKEWSVVDMEYRKDAFKADITHACVDRKLIVMKVCSAILISKSLIFSNSTADISLNT